MVGFGSLERTLLSLAGPGECLSVIEDIQGVSKRRVLISRLSFLRSGMLAGGWPACAACAACAGTGRRRAGLVHSLRINLVAYSQINLLATAVTTS